VYHIHEGKKEMFNAWGTPHVPEGLEEQAACLPVMYPNKWVPVTLRGEYVEADASAAIAICNTVCAIRDACLDHGLRNTGWLDERIIGGTNREQRQAMRSAANAPQQAPDRIPVSAQTSSAVMMFAQAS
jgi:hypothetical protein